jgi:hypothetical protein
MYKVLEPLAHVLAALAVPPALFAAVQMFRFHFGAW